MADSSSSEPGSAGPSPGAAFKDRAVSTRFDLGQAMLWVRQAHGVGLLRQTRQIIALSRRAKMKPREYYENALFRPSLGDDERRAYVTFHSQIALNLRLSPPQLSGLHGLSSDKMLCGMVLAQAGLPTVPTLALHAPGVSVPSLNCLPTPEALADWLLAEAILPVFGKPVNGSLGMGAMSIVGREGGVLVLGDGRKVAARDLTAEMARVHGRGWMVQPLLRLHPDVAELAGSAVAMLRITTLRDAAGPKALYAVLRLPGKGAMIDTQQPWASGGHVEVDLATGALGRAQDAWRMNTTPLATALATGAVLAGRRLPFVAEACHICETAHRLFLQHGVLGFDIALTAEGPVIGEINALPFHTNWQRASDRGLLNPDFSPRIAAALAETERRSAREAEESARVKSGRR